MLEKYLPRIDFDSYEDFKKNYKVNCPDDFNFAYDIVDGWAKAEPEKKALVWCDDFGNEKTFTFTDISKMSNQAANMFKAMGLKKGSVCMLILRRRWEYWICAVGLMKIGAIIVPGTLQLTKKDIAYRANAAHIEAFVCVDDDYVIEQMELALPEAPCIKNVLGVNLQREGWLNFDEELSKYSDEFERPTGDEATKSTDIMQIYFTSGTTGMPKMVCHNYLHPLGHIVTAKYWQRVQENKLHMSVSDSGWAKFGWGKIYGQWICGAVIFAYDMVGKFHGDKLLNVIEKYKLTTFCAPPTMYRFMLQEDVAKYDLSSVQHWATAGEPLNPEVFNKWQEFTGKKIATGFGQTEGTVLIANFPWFEAKPGTLGKPSPIYDIKLMIDGKECVSGDEGEICICGVDKNPPVGLFVGYYKDKEKTEEALGSGIYNLKDVAWRDNDGYYWFVGRHDDVIKCSGYRIGPFEVESALIEHPAVVECAITAAPDPIRGQVVKATVVLAKGYEPSEALIKELQNHVKHATAPYKYPRIVEFVDELPKTLGGKIKRAEIRKADADAAGDNK